MLSVGCLIITMWFWYGVKILLIYRAFCWWSFSPLNRPVLKTSSPNCSMTPNKVEDQWSPAALLLYRWVSWRLESFSDLTIISDPVIAKPKLEPRAPNSFSHYAFSHTMQHYLKIVVKFVSFLTLTSKRFMIVVNDQSNQAK